MIELGSFFHRTVPEYNILKFKFALWVNHLRECPLLADICDISFFQDIVYIPYVNMIYDFTG